jgi:hypothetical protein
MLKTIAHGVKVTVSIAAAVLFFASLGWAANNIFIVGQGGTTYQMKTTETAGVHVPHVNIDAAVGQAAGDAPTTFSAIGGRSSGATGGLDQPVRLCDLFAKYDGTDNGSKTLVTGVSGRKIYVCRAILMTGSTATTLKLREGSDADCASDAADITPPIQLVANDKVGWGGSFWDGMITSTVAYNLCQNASAGNSHQVMVWYTIQ